MHRSPEKSLGVIRKNKIKENEMEKILIQGNHFVDESGHQVLLNGINVVCKDPDRGYLFPGLEDVFRNFSRMGFNLIRLGIFWDGVEPQPGVYDMAYLERVRDAVRLAEQYGMYTLLDMHQDLFSRKWGDGAPAWAALDEGMPHPESCTMWYDAYLQSEAIIRAADNFWKNAPAADGVGLLDHYAAMWTMLAGYFNSCESIIGYEPMNEPFMGSIARMAFGEAAQKTAAQFPDYNPADLTAMKPEQAAFFMGIVSERLTDFDKETLMPFYRRIQKAVESASDKPLVTGGNIYCSSTIPTGITRLDDRDRQIYAPHGYDAVVDSDRYESFNKANVEMLFADKRRSQLEMGLPVIIGEWGAFPSRDFTGDLICHMNGILEEYLWSSTYWQYLPGLDTDPNYAELGRAYPMLTAGTLKAYHYDADAKSLNLSYTAEAGGTTTVYCPFCPSEVQGSCPITSETEMITGQACLIRIRAEEAGELSVTIQ